MQFPPSVWGPFFWHTIHIVALGYPKNPTYTDKKCAKEFYESLFLSNLNIQKLQNIIKSRFLLTL